MKKKARLTEVFFIKPMKKYKVIFADLDGTLIEPVKGKEFPRGIWDMKFKFDVLDKIRQIRPDYLFIVSNQGGIGEGYVDHNNFEKKMQYIKHSLEEYIYDNGNNVFYRYCTQNDKEHVDRKPNTGMLESLRNYLLTTDYNKCDMLMIGDASGKEGQFSDSDKKTAENFGIDYVDVEDFVKI